MRKMSGKVKWAIALLIVWMVLGFGQLVKATGSTSFFMIIATLIEYFPTIAVIVLTHYDHKYESPKNETFTLLRVWALALIWVQPVFSLLSYISADVFTSYTLGVWIGSCIIPLIAFILLYIDGKQTRQGATHNENSNKNSAIISDKKFTLIVMISVLIFIAISLVIYFAGLS